MRSDSHDGRPRPTPKRHLKGHKRTLSFGAAADLSRVRSESKLTSNFSSIARRFSPPRPFTASSSSIGISTACHIRKVGSHAHPGGISEVHLGGILDMHLGGISGMYLGGISHLDELRIKMKQRGERGARGLDARRRTRDLDGARGGFGQLECRAVALDLDAVDRRTYGRRSNSVSRAVARGEVMWVKYGRRGKAKEDVWWRDQVRWAARVHITVLRGVVFYRVLARRDGARTEHRRCESNERTSMVLPFLPSSRPLSSGSNDMFSSIRRCVSKISRISAAA